MADRTLVRAAGPVLADGSGTVPPGPADQVDPADQVAPTPAGVVPAGERGRLTVADRVVRRVATAAAGEVGGVVRLRPGRLTDLTGTGLGHGYPHAEATVAGRRARVRVEVVARWGTPLPALAARVRDRVQERLDDLAAIRADAVDVVIVRVLPPAAGGRTGGGSGSSRAQS